MNDQIKATANSITGKTKIEMIKASGESLSIEVSTNAISQIAATLLDVARIGFEGTGSTTLPTPSLQNSCNVAASSITLGSSPIPNCTSLACYFGETILWISISNEWVGPLGQRLLALGADGPAS